MPIIDPDKIAEVLGVPWEHTELDGAEEDDYVFSLNGGPVLSFTLYEPANISFWCNVHGLTTDNIGFHNITRVEYSKERQAVAFESVCGDFFSDMIIKSNGKFGLEIGKPMSLYSASFCEIISRESKNC